MDPLALPHEIVSLTSCQSVFTLNPLMGVQGSTQLSRPPHLRCAMTSTTPPCLHKSGGGEERAQWWITSSVYNIDIIYESEQDKTLHQPPPEPNTLHTHWNPAAKPRPLCPEYSPREDRGETTPSSAQHTPYWSDAVKTPFPPPHTTLSQENLPSHMNGLASPCLPLHSRLSSTAKQLRSVIPELGWRSGCVSTSQSEPRQ